MRNIDTGPDRKDNTTRRAPRRQPEPDEPDREDPGEPLRDDDDDKDNA